MVRAVHSKALGQGNTGRYVHILAEHGAFPGRQSLCTKVVFASPVVLDPMPVRPPEGRRWCCTCIGRLAERLGMLEHVAAELAAQAATGDGADV